MRKIVNAFKKLKNKNWAVLTLNALALFTVIQNGCAWLEHQPEVPEEARRFRKF